MSTAPSLVGIVRQATEELSFAEIEEQHVALLPARTVLQATGSPGGPLGNIIGTSIIGLIGGGI